MNWSHRTMLRQSVCLSIIIVLFWLSVGPCSTAFSEEPFEDYLEALEERGYIDTAFRYLDRMATSSLAPNSLKSEIEYRKAKLSIASARLSKNSTQRQQLLGRAKTAFERFINDQPDHPSVFLARNQLGNIMVEQARTLKSQSKSDAANRKSLASQSFDAYEDAYAALKESRVEIGEQYKLLATKRDADSKVQVKRVKDQYIQTYLNLGRVLFEQAETVQDNGKLYEEKLKAASVEFDEVAQKYRKFSAGLFATLYQGQCCQLLGEHKRALNYYRELLQNPDKSPPVRMLKTTALAKSIESWIATDPNQGPSKAIEMAEQWQKTKRGAEARQPAWLEMQLALAKAYLAHSKVAQNDAQANRAVRDAREIASALAKRKSGVQRQAQELLVNMGGSSAADKADADADTGLAESFVAARDLAKSSLDRMKLKTTAISLFRSQLRTTTNPERRSAIEGRLAKTEIEKDELANKTLELFQHADSLAAPEDADSLAGVRYYIAYLHYALKNYRKAAVVGSHTALSNPDSMAAKQCANVALASRQRLYQELPEAQRQAQSDSIAKLGKLIVSRWPGDPQAEAALTTLMDMAISQGKIEEAESYLAKIPESSGKRISAELRLGQKLWREYLNSQGTEKADTSAALEQQASQWLSRGLSKAKEAPATDAAIRGALTLAKIHLNDGDATAALALLRSKNIGALNLVEENSPWLKRIPGLAADTYSTAIRAKIASAAVGDSDSAIAAAQDMLGSLQEDLAKQPDGEKKMTSIYVGLARDLEQQLATATPQAKKALSKGFEAFLEKAAEGTDNLSVLNWVGQTYFGMGNGLIEGNKRTPEAQRYFAKAATAYNQVLEATQQQGGTDDQILQVKVKQAMALRELGKFEQAIALFLEVLTKKRYLNMQVEAAKTLQRWGESGNLAAFNKAIAGDQPGRDGKNIIWGWGRLAKLLANESSNRATFHEARYNIALCRYQMAKRQKGTEQKKLLLRAKSDLTLTERLYDLGDAAQKKKYDVLLRQIQKSLGEPAKGFSS